MQILEYEANMMLEAPILDGNDGTAVVRSDRRHRTHDTHSLLCCAFRRQNCDHELVEAHVIVGECDTCGACPVDEQSVLHSCLTCSNEDLEDFSHDTDGLHILKRHLQHGDVDDVFICPMSRHVGALFRFQ